MSAVLIHNRELEGGEPIQGAVEFQDLSNTLLHMDVTGGFRIYGCGLHADWTNYGDCYLVRLPLGALFLIDVHARASPGGIMFDLNAKKAYVLKMGLLGVNPVLQPIIQDSSRRIHNNVTIKMSTQHIYTYFNNFRALGE